MLQEGVLREEILEALAKQESFRRRQSAAYHQGPMDQALERIQSGELGKESAQQREQLERYFDALTDCLRSAADVSEAYAGTDSMIIVRWDADDKHQVIIELSPYGPLVAVFVYGPVPPRLRGDVDRCVAATGLIHVSDEELDALEPEHGYSRLFEW